MAEFDDKTVLITGGGSGMGLATARRLVEQGASVVLAGRNADRLDAAAKELDAGDRVLTVPCDVSRADDLDRLVDRIRDHFGRIDGVFANAGAAEFAPGAAVTESAFDAVVATNFKGVYFTVQKAASLLNDGGAVVINGSWLVHRGLAFTSVYAATKAAVVNLARTFAAELASRNIRVNALSPGYIRTEMFDGISTTEEAREACRSQVILGRLGQADDVASVALFLLSPAASYVTGQELLVDGGLIPSAPA